MHNGIQRVGRAVPFLAVLCAIALVALSPVAPSAGAAAKIAPPVQPLLAWTVARDTGDVFVLDATASLYRLSPADLAPLNKSTPLFAAQSAGSAYLAADDAYLFVSSLAISRTLVLRRSDFARLAVLNEAGHLAVDPGRKLFIIWQSTVVSHDLRAIKGPPAVVVPAPNPIGGYVPHDIVAAPAARRLYIRMYGAFGSPPHNRESYHVYDLDTLKELTQFSSQLGALSRLALADEADTLAVTNSAYAGLLASSVTLFDRDGAELRNAHPLDGTPAIDSKADWLYLLRERGLWVLNVGDLSWRSILPFQTDPPADLALSPDGQHLYLFGKGWLMVRETADLQARGVAPVSPFPAAWLKGPDYSVGPAFFPSPDMTQDGTAFAQVGVYGETYRTTDGGRSWLFLPALTYPDFQYVLHFSFSPEFGRDRTLVAAGHLHALLRSTDAGQTWEFWMSRIAFVSDQGGNRDLYTMNQDGGEVQRLTDAPSAEENPAWSPAWTRLAFQSNRTGNWDIFTIRADCSLGQGCDLRQLTDNAADDMLPAWSPDGRSIAFVSTRDGNPEIYVMDRDGQNPRRLTFSPTGDWRPAWMPDGRHLLFTSDRGGNNDIYELEVPVPSVKLTAEPKITPIVADSADDRDPAVSAWGILAFLSDRGGAVRVYRKDLLFAGAGVYSFGETHDARTEGHPSWVDEVDVHGGGLLISIEQQAATQIYQVYYPDHYVPLTSGSVFNGHPAWGPTWWRPDTTVSRDQLKVYAK